jgi:hypothetical protein
MFFIVNPILNTFSLKTALLYRWSDDKNDSLIAVAPEKNKTIPVGKINTNFIRVSQKNSA